MTISINGSACVSLVLNESWTSARCVAPAGGGVVPLTVNVSGQLATVQFAYSRPSVLLVSPRVLDAMSGDGVITVCVCLHCVLFVVICNESVGFGNACRCLALTSEVLANRHQQCMLVTQYAAL